MRKLEVIRAEDMQPPVLTGPEEAELTLMGWGSTYDALEEAYAAKKIHPMDLKSVVAKEVNALLTPFRKRHAGLLRLAKEGYPG